MGRKIRRRCGFQTTRTRGGLRTDVQKPVLGQEDGSGGVRDARRFVVESPLDVVGFPDVPYDLVCWVEDLGNPYIPSGEIHRGGKGDRGSGEEQSSEGSHEFHREWIEGVVRCGRWWLRSKGRKEKVEVTVRLVEDKGRLEGKRHGFCTFVGAAPGRTRNLSRPPGPVGI